MIKGNVQIIQQNRADDTGNKGEQNKLYMLSKKISISVIRGNMPEKSRETRNNKREGTDIEMGRTF